MTVILERLRSRAVSVGGRRSSMPRLRLLLAALSACALWFGVASAAHAVTYSNAGTISINDATDASPTDIPAKATPYPSDISVSGLAGPVTKVTATLHGFHHTCPTDLDVLLVGPQGQKTLLMSDAGDCSNGAGTAHDPIDLTFDDGGPPVPCLGGNPSTPPLAGGTYAPTNSPMSAPACYWDDKDPDSFGAPAPAGPYPASMSIFSGADPNGSWRLYVMDQFSDDVGAIDGGWSLDLTVPPPTVGAPANSGAAEVGRTTRSSGVDLPIVSTAGTKKTQRVVKRGGLVVLAKSNIAGSLIAGATVNVPNTSKTYRFKSVARTLAAGVTTRAKLMLPKRGLSAVRNALNGGQKLMANLRLTVTDSNGGKTTKHLSIRLSK
jgi:hypothetical protein